MQLVKFELYKLAKQKMIWIAGFLLILAFGFISVMNIQSGTAFSYNYSLYKGHEGKINQQEVKKKQKELNNFLEHNPSPFTKKENENIYYLMDFTNAGDQLVSYQEQMRSLEKQINKPNINKTSFSYKSAKYQLEKLKDIGEPNFYYTKAWQYVSAFTDFIGPLLISIMIIIGISSIFSKEHTTGMYQFILSSKDGRKKSVTAKIIASFIYVFFTCTTFFSACLLSSIVYWGIYGYNVPLRNLNVLSDTFLSIKVWQYIIIEYSLYLLGALAFTALIIFISSLSKSSLSGILWGAAVISFPVILRTAIPVQLHWIDVIGDFSYLTLMAVYNLFRTYNVYNVMGYPVPQLFLTLPLFVVLSIIFLYGTFQSIKRKQFV
jgi:hypothetical protein